MNISQLGYIIALSNTGSFVEAAAKCFVTQPTLSMQIQKLEEEVGIVLFDRSTHPIMPTSAGSQIIEQAKIATMELKRVLELSKEIKGVVAGQFRLGIIPTISSSLLPLFLPKFIKNNPLIELSIHEAETNELIEMLEKDKLDGCIAATPLKNNKLVEDQLYYEPFMAFIPKNHDLFKDDFILHSDLKAHQLLLLKQGHCFRNSMLKICNTKLDSQVNIESGNFSTLVGLSKNGLGITLIPYLYALTLNEDRKCIKPLSNPQPAREISLITSIYCANQGLSDIIKQEILGVLPKKLTQQENLKTIPPY